MKSFLQASIIVSILVSGLALFSYNMPIQHEDIVMGDNNKIIIEIPNEHIIAYHVDFSGDKYLITENNCWLLSEDIIPPIWVYSIQEDMKNNY